MCEPIRLQEILYPVLVMARTVYIPFVFIFILLFSRCEDKRCIYVYVFFKLHDYNYLQYCNILFLFMKMFHTADPPKTLIHNHHKHYCFPFKQLDQ